MRGRRADVALFRAENALLSRKNRLLSGVQGKVTFALRKPLIGNVYFSGVTAERPDSALLSRENAKNSLLSGAGALISHALLLRVLRLLQK